MRPPAWARQRCHFFNPSGYPHATLHTPLTPAHRPRRRTGQPVPARYGQDQRCLASLHCANHGRPAAGRFQGISNPSVDYQSIDLLLSLQHPRSQGYGEMCFFIMGQVKKLLFRGLHFELYTAQLQMRADNVVNALEILPRAKATGEYITRSWDVFSTISPEGFNQFRDSPGSASGQLSFMHRHAEFVLGNKDRRLASAFCNMAPVWPGIEAALNSRSLYDDAIALLARRSFALDSAALERDWSLPYAINPTVEQATRET